MAERYLYAPGDRGLTDAEIRELLLGQVEERPMRRALLIPPDITRFNSYAGPMACMLYELLTERGVQVEVLPALGSHQPMTAEELAKMYPVIPPQRVLVHHWREDTCCLGEIPQAVTVRLSQGRFARPIPVELNRRLLEGGYDRIFSIGQVVPHEVVGMANYLKNLFVGCGGSAMINASHYMGALYGMERMLGRDHTPVHELFDYARAHFIPELPVTFLMTVNTLAHGQVKVRGLFAGESRQAFEKAVALSQQENIIFLEKPLAKVVAYLDGFEFKRMWVGNKAIYRTRMAIADGGELVIIAPGVAGVGEDPQNDAILCRYGYCGSAEVNRAVQAGEELAGNLSAAAHILHSSPDGRFHITYAPGQMAREAVERVHFGYLPLEEALARYPVGAMAPGFNEVNGEIIYFIPNPAVGLWACRKRFFKTE